DHEAAKIFARPELSTDWGSRGLSNQSTMYDPLSYNNGTAWPYGTGLVAWAQYANGQPLAGYQSIMSLVHLTGIQVPGGMPEHMVGNRNEPGARSVPRQLFSSWSLIRPVVKGMLAQSMTNPPVAVVPIKPTPEIGAPNSSLKILNVTPGEKERSLTIDLAGLGGRTYNLDLRTQAPKISAEGAKDIHKSPDGFTLEIVFEGGEDYVEKSIKVKY
ncbi:MAG TPA: hypothetical protein VFU86_15390, partial [Terriglobales bacterium]|nr:hypothetical protein [Terriglobales bacterium]